MSSRSKVLNIYKKLHRTSQLVFNGDIALLTAARNKINEEFRKHLTVEEPERVEELLKVANEAEVTLRTEVIQARQTSPGVYKVKITEDKLLKNAPPPKRGSGRARRKRSEENPS